MNNRLNIILVIEDNPTNMRLTTDILKRQGYTVIQADNAELGIEMALQEKPNLILMDIHLPKMDGLTATKILKSEESLKKTLIIALTANAMTGDEADVLAAGCDDYIPKPIRYKSFIEKIDELLRKL